MSFIAYHCVKKMLNKLFTWNYVAEHQQNPPYKTRLAASKKNIKQFLIFLKRESILIKYLNFGALSEL